jgi:hypothetical protein
MSGFPMTKRTILGVSLCAQLRRDQHKQHQAGFAQALLDEAFQLGKRAGFVSGFPEFGHIRMTNQGIESWPQPDRTEKRKRGTPQTDG